ncbi:transporter [Tolypocladium capitatum]|uniref:Transporter n=1 Tax=Tolypocladium capitatum TaxID=45235 RepID=A0A2K3Q7F1_9HYPO|nr:transporter [Tolypocladium capitatum]
MADKTEQKDGPKGQAEKTEQEDGPQRQADDAAVGSASAEKLSPEEDKRLLRKIDMCLLPVMAFSYLFQYLDKSAMGFTAILGLLEDLHLTGRDFSWAGGVYYFGYLIASYPAGVLMVRWRVGRTIAVAVILWGVVLMLTAVASNAAGLLALRFFLGVCEAPIAPGLTVVVSMWYKRSEQPLRHAAWFMGNSAAGIIGGLAAYGIGHVDGIAPWKAVFLIFGGATVAWSVGIYFLLPDVPMTAGFLKDADRIKAITRVQENRTGIKSDQFKWQQCREALLDVKTWFIVVIQLCGSIPNGGVQNFGSIVIRGLGFGTFPTLLLQSASYVVQFVLVLVATGGSTYLCNTRTYFMAWNLAVSVVGCVMVRQLPVDERWARYAGYCLLLAFSANFPMIMAMTSGNVGGFTKKVTANAMSFIAYCVGNIIGPQLFFASEAPSYTSGFLAMMVCFVVGFASCIAFRLYLIRENRRRDQAGGASQGEADTDVMLIMMDKTDREIPRFRYVY